MRLTSKFCLVNSTCFSQYADSIIDYFLNLYLLKKPIYLVCAIPLRKQNPVYSILHNLQSAQNEPRFYIVKSASGLKFQGHFLNIVISCFHEISRGIHTQIFIKHRYALEILYMNYTFRRLLLDSLHEKLPEFQIFRRPRLRHLVVVQSVVYAIVLRLILKDFLPF